MTINLTEPAQSETAAPRSDISDPASTPKSRRVFKAFALLALLPIAGLAFVTFELARTSMPHRMAANPLASLGALSLRGSLTGTQGALPVLRHEDPIARYAEQRGIQPINVNYSVAPGDTLISVLTERGVRDEDAQAFIAELRSAGLASELKIRPKQAMTFNLGGAMNIREPRPLLGASIHLDAERRIDVTRDPAGEYHADLAHVELARQEVLARGVITQSLAADAADAGVSYGLIAKFADIYAYDVDFQRDIKPDDSFEIYYTKYVSPDGEVDPAKSEILFSRLSFNGKVKTYYRYAAADGTVDYYDENGKSARTFLMKTPVEGARISSGFGMRLHPILGYTRMHKGVDFAAPSGTKIYASGSGVIEFSGVKGGFGNYVRIRHDSGYETAYGHMRAFGKGIHAGVRVAQGAVIGYVGMTGDATGPHLHYEVLQAGNQINPMSVRVPTGRKLAGADLDQFRRQTEKISLAMKSNPAAQLAANGPDDGRAR